MLKIFGRRRDTPAGPVALNPRPAPVRASASTLEALAGGADRIAVVDCETTGVYNSDRVIEVGIVTMDLSGAVIDTWETLVHPERDVGASHIHGLTAASVRDAPVFADIAGDVAVRLHGACLAAHNLPFDARMLGNEFIRVGADLTVLSGIDTLTATRCRLAVACSGYGIQIDHAHSALADAYATAELLNRVRSSCNAGSPVAAPTALTRSGRTLPRSATMPVVIPDPPYLAALIAGLNHGGVEAATLAYLELVGLALADLRLEPHERKELALLAETLGLNSAATAQAHRRFVNDLVDAALADHVVTDDELDLIFRVARSLEIEQARVEQRTRTSRALDARVVLAAGMCVVFTGDDPEHARSELTEHAEALAMTVGKGVSKTTDLLVAYESNSASGKAKKAHAYGVPIVSTRQFAAAGLGDVLDALGTGGSRKVITCPDCNTTWTVDARTTARARRRCEDCGASTPTASRQPSARRTEAPTSEELTCELCGRIWSRERTRVRKPQRCPTCAGGTGS